MASPDASSRRHRGRARAPGGRGGGSGRRRRESLPTWPVLRPFLLLVLGGERWQRQPAGAGFPSLCPLPSAAILNSAPRQQGTDGQSEESGSRDLSEVTHGSDSPHSPSPGCREPLCALHQQQSLRPAAETWHLQPLSRVSPCGDRRLTVPLNSPAVLGPAAPIAGGLWGEQRDPGEEAESCSTACPHRRASAGPQQGTEALTPPGFGHP